MKKTIDAHGGVVAAERECLIVPADHPGEDEALSQASAAADIMFTSPTSASAAS